MFYCILYFNNFLFIIYKSMLARSCLPLAPEFCFLILAHSVCKMWIIHEAKNVALWNKRHFEEKKMENVQACLKYSVPIFVEWIYKIQRPEVSAAVRPLYGSLGVKGLSHCNIYTPIWVQPEDGSKKPKHVAESCIFTKLLKKSSIRKYYII